VDGVLVETLVEGLPCFEYSPVVGSHFPGHKVVSLVSAQVFLQQSFFGNQVIAQRMDAPLIFEVYKYLHHQFLELGVGQASQAIRR